MPNNTSPLSSSPRAGAGAGAAGSGAPITSAEQAAEAKRAAQEQRRTQRKAERERRKRPDHRAIAKAFGHYGIVRDDEPEVVDPPPGGGGGGGGGDDDDDDAEEREERGGDPEQDPEREPEPKHRSRVDPEYVRKLRSEKRRRAARGSPTWRYFAIRLQLRGLLTSARTLCTLFVTLLLTLAIWLLLVFGRPNEPNVYWTNLNTYWGGDLGNASACEARTPDAFTEQPADGLATVAYALVGVLILNLFLVDSRHLLSFEARFGNMPASIIVRQPGWSFLIGCSLLFLAVMAWLRNASNSVVGERLETTAYWCVMFALCTCSLARMMDAPKKVRSADQESISYVVSLLLILGTVAVDIGFGVRLEVLQGTMQAYIVFGVLSAFITVAVLVHWYLHSLSMETDMWYGPIAAALFGVGYALIKYDNTTLCTNPNAFVQPYGGWHLLLALSVLSVYFLFRSDLWLKGDGAETTPKLRPLLRARLAGRYVYEAAEESCVSKDRLKRIRKERRRTKSGRRVHLRKDGKFVDDLGYGVPAARLKTFRSVQSIVEHPERGFTQKQIRLAEFACGLLLVAVIAVVAYYALTAMH